MIDLKAQIRSLQQMKIMFNFRFNSILHFQLKYSFSSRHRIYQKKNNSIMILEDFDSKLPYMAEVQLSDSSKGVVMKIQEKGKAYLAMYEQVKASPNNINQVQIVKITKNWRQSLNPLIQQTLQSQSHFQNNAFYDVNTSKIQQNNLNRIPSIHQSTLQITNGKKRRLKTSSPILNVCHDLYYGDMISFMGCRGSRKSSNSWNIAKQFTQTSNSNLAVYLNPNLQQVKAFTQVCPSSLSFTIPYSKKPTDVGVYMLTVKAIHFASQLKKKGHNVLLIVDNLSEIMYREWNLLQSIKFDSKVIDSSNIFQYNTLKIPPVSILNQIYSNCEDNYIQKNKSNYPGYKNGSMTTILISEKQNNDLVQQITSYSNNLKHLQTLSSVIEFPLNFKINTNLYYQKPKSQQQFDSLKQEKGFEEKELHRFLRSYINKYLNEKRQTEMRRQLYKNDMKQAPWDYFFILDSEWWINGIKQMSNTCKSFEQANQFLRWVVYNIEHDYLGHWNLSAKESYLRLISFLKNQQNLEEKTPVQKILLSQEDMESFIDDAKMEGLMSPFKKDYLI